MTLISKIGLFSTLHLIWSVAWGCLRIRIRLICTASLQLFTAFFETEYVKYDNFRGLLYPFDLVNGMSAEHLEYLMEIYIDYSGLSPQNRGPIHTKWQQSCKTLSANCCLKHKLLIIDHKIFFQAFKTLFLNLCQTFPFHRMRKKKFWSHSTASGFTLLRRFNWIALIVDGCFVSSAWPSWRACKLCCCWRHANE